MKNKYICMTDYQGGEFAVGDIATAKEWGEIAYSWAESDDWENPSECLLKNFKNENELIDFIQEIWELEIVKIEKNNKRILEFLKDVSNFNSWQLKDVRTILKELEE